MTKEEAIKQIDGKIAILEDKLDKIENLEKQIFELRVLRATQPIFYPIYIGTQETVLVPYQLRKI